ncbi:hypothetical protein [Ochrobactrum soli]|uniref:SMODS and SLOG-associating 2TM effector domain-containing protein n=1 Tax=Ochrobactrum soli TaxID=2448455 RepID=A0A849KKW9_9HYPH|nr:hypothetical protein [[Ochrobactrum] soli]NNU62455.1 hypothetical protein [[Ochrobactrum] soli]
MNFEDVRFNVLRNALYHTAMRRHFEKWNRWFNFLVVLLGAAAIADALGRWGIPPYVVGTAIAGIGAAQLAFNFGGNASLHQQLQRDYYNLLADMDGSLNYSDEDVAKWYSSMIRITGDEPPTMRTVDAKAYNDAIDATERQRDERLYIPFLHWLFEFWFSSEGYTFEKLAERKSRIGARKVRRKLIWKR